MNQPLYIKYQILSIRYRKSDIRYEVSSSCYWASDVKYKISILRYQVSYIKNQISRIRYQVSDIKYQISSIRYQVSYIKYHISSISYPVLDIKYIILPWEFWNMNTLFFTFQINHFLIILVILKMRRITCFLWCFLVSMSGKKREATVVWRDTVTELGYPDHNCSCQAQFQTLKPGSIRGNKWLLKA